MLAVIRKSSKIAERFISKLVNAGVFVGMDPKLKKNVILSNRVALLFLATALIIHLAYVVLGVKILIISATILDALLAISIYINYSGWYYAARFTILVAVNLACLSNSWIIGRDAGIQYGFFILVTAPLVFFRLSQIRYIITGSILSVLCYFIITLLPAQLFYPSIYTDELKQIIKEVFTILVIFGNFYIVYSLHVVNESSEKQLEMANNELNDKLEQLKVAQDLLLENAREAGMAEIATGILHNVGNTLNSVIAAAEILKKILKHNSECTEKFVRSNQLLQQNLSNLGDFLTNDPKGKILPQFYMLISKSMVDDIQAMRSEITEFDNKIELIREIVSSQQAFAKKVEIKNEIDIADIIESALATQLSDLADHNVKVVKKISYKDKIFTHKTKLIYVLINLIVNAKEAMELKDKKILLIDVGQKDESDIYIKLTDNGLGIAKENLNRIFNYGFTTKKHGHGFGLHYSANAITEMGGNISVSSDGIDKGATFTILLPRNTSKNVKMSHKSASSTSIIPA